MTEKASDVLSRRLALLQQEQALPLLCQGLRGIEKESLRVDGQGRLAMTPHPATLGSALTHPQLTTDYSEALLEFVSPTTPDAALTLERLDTLHRFVYQADPEELLWSSSMPCALPEEEQIPIAQYGSSHIGRLKHLYRLGLALRYGRTMQCIAGIHYNYSLSEALWPVLRQAEGGAGDASAYQSEAYLALIRNFQRYSWLLLYLFGASPALDRQFLRGQPHQLEDFDAHTLYLPYATSLRMSDLGYQNSAQAGLMPSLDSFPAYLQGLTRAIKQPYAAYQAMGTHRHGEWVQINTNVLQIENELYASIRPKRATGSGERPLQALSTRGVQYIEVRCMDVDPFEPLGISLTTARFLDAFLLFCALEDSPLFGETLAEADQNTATVAKQGRQPGLQLQQKGQAVALADWAQTLMDQVDRVAHVLDAAHGTAAHAEAVVEQRRKLADPSLTSSARMLDTMRARGESFQQFAFKQSQVQAAYFRQRVLPEADYAVFSQLAHVSLQEQAELERQSTGSFDAFVAAYQAFTLNRIST